MSEDGSDIEYYSTEQLLDELRARTENPEPQVKYIERPVSTKLACAVCGDQIINVAIKPNGQTMTIPISHFCTATGQVMGFTWEVTA